MSHRDDILADRLNVEPVIFKGCSSSELGVIVGVAALVECDQVGKTDCSTLVLEDDRPGQFDLNQATCSLGRTLQQAQLSRNITGCYT